MSTMKAFIIQPGDTSAAVTDLERGAQPLQQAVGGYIEAVAAHDKAGNEITFWVNEEGKLHGLEANGYATALWWLLSPHMVNQDILVGPVVITGGPDRKGDTLPVPDTMIDLVSKLYVVEEGK